jgi:hypothetical protein
MKRLAVIFLIFLFLMFIKYIYTATDAGSYSRKQAIEICDWLNSEASINNYPPVGPMALKELFTLKSSHMEGNDFQCIVKKGHGEYDYKNQHSVVVQKKDVVLINLVYGREYFQPRYFRYWTPQ